MQRDLTRQCLSVADGWEALACAIRITRLQLIAAGEIFPLPGEELPETVRKAAQEHWRRVAKRAA